jgi:hypothetical protein
MYVASQLKVAFDDKSEQVYDLGYQPFFVTGDMVSDGKGGQVLAGGYYDIYNNKIIDKTVAGKERHFFSDAPDGTSLLTVPNAKVDGVKGKPVFAVVQFEYTTWARTASRYVRQAALAHRRADAGPGPEHRQAEPGEVPQRGHLQGPRPVDHLRRQPVALGHPPVQRRVRARCLRRQRPVAGLQPEPVRRPSQGQPLPLRPPARSDVNVDGTATIKKHFCMGRISHELVQVMPDQRTALMGDDATNGGCSCSWPTRKRPVLGHAVRGQVGAGFSIDPAAKSAAR